MTVMSGLLGYDLSTVDPHQSLADLKVPGTQGHIKAWTEHGANTIYQASVGHASGAGPAVVGTPVQVADWMCDTMEYVGGDGFVFEPLYLPHDLYDFNRKVVPILQKRGFTRKTYNGKTLRDNVTAF